MKKPLFLAGALFSISMCSALEPLPETWNE